MLMKIIYRDIFPDIPTLFYPCTEEKKKARTKYELSIEPHRFKNLVFHMFTPYRFIFYLIF